MSYAVETKKRKFDRILEALSDSAATASRTSLSSRNNTSSTSLTQDTASELSKRRRITPTSQSPTSSPSPTTLSGHYLPSSRAAFLQRLETFRPVTKWHIPSTDSINAAAWAKRGWTCVDTDTVFCGACKERLYIGLDVDSEILKARGKEGEEKSDSVDEDDSFAVASEIYYNIVKRYEDMIVTAHAEGCLWRNRGCDSSIQRIEGLLNTGIAISGLKNRYDSIAARPEEIPDVVSLPSSPLINPQDLEQFRFNEEEPPEANALRLAVCGWERKCEDVIECRHCFRSLGLWLYRGELPAIEKLNGVDNHLEYCPWRSAEAQDTEILIAQHRKYGDSAPKKERVAGWVLVYQAVVKNMNKKRGSRLITVSAASSEAEPATGSSESMTPEQREKMMRDLFRRIKEIKKPFNVKALLKRKGKDQTLMG
ncbi:uncharacterized protein Z518_07248 [Rhinocladiella mackenziei CBS 650.93]|uniref:C3HC-type domain-containing protein n=1 Tax=Rhinocladiella mackenziei CBS 650.93 TaxID=1442369 RepID=A0A0D2J3X4_9EURO|nr:uncharacterized protein Z518_07248 [Rhinocladiella mackenziei CBS 650.93]KIX03695.1 hypothetical protein Z518_07248 [Rhinocladiella mackenziei CBS 650.93]